MAIVESKYREKYAFGLGEDTLYQLKNPTKPSTPDFEFNERIKQIAYSHGCPRPDFCIKEYGADYMFKRYLELNARFKFITDTAARYNPSLFRDLTTPTLRLLPDEPVGIYEPMAVPGSHLREIAPMAGLIGYALPRVSMEFDKVELLKSIRVVSEFTRTSDNPGELLSRLCQSAVLAGADRTRVLSHAYGANILTEENTDTLFIAMAELYQQDAPALWKTYESLLTTERKELGIAEVPNI